MDKAGEEAAPALAVAIRQAGRAASWLRRMVAYCALAGYLLDALVALLREYRRAGHFEAIDRVLEQFVVGGMLASAATLLLGLGVAVVFRRLRANALRRRLATLPSPEREALLIPLLDERGDGQKIVRYLLGARRSAAEMVPAVAPTGRGDEAPPTG